MRERPRRMQKAQDEPERISNRRELFDFLGHRMQHVYRNVLDADGRTREARYPRSFLLEFDWLPQNLRCSEGAYLTEALTLPTSRAVKEPCKPRVEETDEAGFFKVTWARPRRAPVQLYLDTSADEGRRFWTAYSVSDAHETDTLIDGLTGALPAFDRVWLWPGFLSGIEQLGELWGVGLDYDHRCFEDKQRRPDSRNFLRLQLRGGGDTRAMLNRILEDDPKGATIGKLILRYRADAEHPSQFSHEDVKYNGRFITKGTSFDSHQRLLSGVRRTYAAHIRALEATYRLNYGGDGKRFEITGKPILFDLQRDPISDLDGFCRQVFSGHMPFRLWGMPERTTFGDDGRIVSAVDLHTGSRLCFEVYADSIYLSLYPGACGNTVARFFTNLQHHLGHAVKWEGHDGSVVVQL